MRNFKCRCCNLLNQRTTGILLMSGEFHYHIGLVNLIKPEGLHRQSYRLDDFDGLFDDDYRDPFTMVVRRTSKIGHNFKNNFKA